MKNYTLRCKLCVFVLLVLRVLFVNALVYTVLSGQARCSNSIDVPCQNEDIPLNFCSSPVQITNETLVRASASSFLTCDYQEGPPSSGQGKFFGYNETTIWVAMGCKANFRICTDTMSTQKLRSSTLSAIKMSLFTETMTSGSKFSNKEQTTPTISPTTSTLPLESSTGTRTTLSTTITANTTETSSTQVTSKPRYVRITSVVFQTVEATTFTTEPFSANSVSVTTVSVGVRNEDEEKSKGIRTDTWVVVGVLLAGFAVLTSVVGIPLCKLTSCTQRRSSRVSASRNEV